VEPKFFVPALAPAPVFTKFLLQFWTRLHLQLVTVNKTYLLTIYFGKIIDLAMNAFTHIMFSWERNKVWGSYFRPGAGAGTLVLLQLQPKISAPCGSGAGYNTVC
jgi:hypothetical protein